MSVRGTNANGPYDVARLRIEFEGGEIPWMYPLALNGRVIQGVFVDGERYTHEHTCRMEYQTEGMQRGWWKCLECGEAMDTIEACGGRKPPRWCGNCGARVEEGGE